MSLAWMGSLLIGLSTGAAAWGLVSSEGSWLDQLERNWADQLRRLRVSTVRLRLYLVIWLGLVGTTAVILWIGFGVPLFALGCAAALLTVPWLVIRRLARLRRERIEDQLADAMVSLSSSIRAGLSLPQSLEVLATQCPRPIREEFQQIHGEYQLGKTLDVCLSEARVRLKSEHFALFAAAMEASRQSGGRLNEVVERIAVSVRELHRLERKILSETAESRRSALYMSLAPGVILAMYWAFLDPDSVERLFTHPMGQLVLVFAAGLNVLAWIWAQRILDADL